MWPVSDTVSPSDEVIDVMTTSVSKGLGSAFNGVISNPSATDRRSNETRTKNMVHEFLEPMSYSCMNLIKTGRDFTSRISSSADNCVST